MSHPHFASPPSPPPAHLVPDLRLALGILYSLPHPQPVAAAAARPTSAQAHEHLLQFQSRNGRRRLQSQARSQRNRLLNLQEHHHEDAPSIGVDVSDIGSSWLACLSVLFSFVVQQQQPEPQQTRRLQDIHQSEVNYAEALFAAQTLVHRARRVRLAEAIDIEFEPLGTVLFGGAADGSDTNAAPKTLPTYPPQPLDILNGYRLWILQFESSSLSRIGNLSSILDGYQQVVVEQQDQDLEERIKGDLSLLVLASILVSLTEIQYNHHHHRAFSSEGNGISRPDVSVATADSQISAHRPLLSTVASSMAIVAARMRYLPTSLPEPAPHTQPIVTMILGSLQMMLPPQSSSTLSQLQPQREDLLLSLYYTCLTALPEAVLVSASGGSSDGGGGGGGAHGKLSLEPRCFTAVTTELKTQGVAQMWQNLQELTTAATSPLSSTSLVQLLQMCESWAKYVPLPMEFVHRTVPLIQQTWIDVLESSNGDNVPTLSRHPVATAAMGYWIAIMEGGSWTVDQVLSASLFQNREASQQPNKKRQSSKSKRREQQVLEERTTDDLLVLAQNEVRHRGRVACEVARATWNPQFQGLLQNELQRIAVACRRKQEMAIVTDFDYDDEEDVRGDGPVGGVAACANACLPYLLRTASLGEHDSNHMALFASISHAIQQVCRSPSRMVRSFAAESLFSLHEVLVEILATDPSSLSGNFLDVIVEFFFQSSMGLASQCGYPARYFDDLGRSNDEDLESERNDVRDLLRTIAGISSSLSENPASLLVTSTILLRLVQACAQPIQEATSSNMLFPETALHAFSALAKPINTVASLFVKSARDVTNRAAGDSLDAILSLTFEIMSLAGKCIIHAFSVVSQNEILPLSRLYNLAVASLSPTLSTLASVSTMESAVKGMMEVGIEAAVISLLSLPELSGPSSLRSTRFDIRGAMRSPGGEDHVGVLALMRLSSESDALAKAFITTKDSVVLDLCSVYDHLKRMEDGRGPGVFYGRGVLPKSRRILMSIICRLERTSAGSTGASGVLAALFNNSIDAIVKTGENGQLFNAGSLFRVSESTFDIASFSPATVNSLFAISDVDCHPARCLQVLHDAVNAGYVCCRDPEVQFETLVQWNRARAALFTLLRTSGNPDLPPIGTDMLISLIKMECDAILAQCSEGPGSPSRIFCEDIVSEEAIPAGLFVQVLVETLENAIAQRTPIPMLKNTLRVLYESRHSVLHSIVAACPSPIQKGAFTDPRHAVAETWFLSMKQLSAVIASQGGLNAIVAMDPELDSLLRTLLVDTCAAAIGMLLYPSLGKTQSDRKEDPGMNLDGPQGLAMTDFFEAYFDLGPVLLNAAASKLNSTIPVDQLGDPGAAGMAIIGASLFRAAQGGLPPWAVERIPSVYSSLFRALSNNVDSFGHLLEWSMNVRLRQNHTFGSVNGGDLLSGRFFERMGEKAKLSFLEQAKENARVNNGAAWKRLKVLIKQACGGKKKDTDFNQRPAFTRWDAIDRI